jgi:hypothetical protein
MKYLLGSVSFKKAAKKTGMHDFVRHLGEFHRTLVVVNSRRSRLNGRTSH